MKKIKTNYGQFKSYALCNGNDKKGWIMKTKDSCRESDKEFFERLVNSGYTTISFYEVSTRVRGLHDVIAYVKR